MKPMEEFQMVTINENVGETVTSQAKDGSKVKEIMTPEHPQWELFVVVLMGPRGCNFHKGKKGPNWTCDSRIERPLTRAILKKWFPQIDIDETLAFFDSHGGLCDCEIIFNVEENYKARQKRAAEKPPEKI
jgi:hypothetical protein